MAAIAVAILWFTGFFGGHEVSSVSIANSPNQVAIEFSTALLEGDGQAFIDLMPDPVVSDVIEDSGFSDETEMASYLENYLSTSINYITAMGGTLDFTVEDSTPVSDSDLAEIQDLYSKYNLTVIAAEDVPVTFTIKLSGSEDVTDDETIPVIQIGQTWYLDYCRWDTD